MAAMTTTRRQHSSPRSEPRQLLLLRLLVLVLVLPLPARAISHASSRPADLLSLIRLPLLLAAAGGSVGLRSLLPAGLLPQRQQSSRRLPCPQRRRHWRNSSMLQQRGRSTTSSRR